MGVLHVMYVGVLHPAGILGIIWFAGYGQGRILGTPGSLWAE